MVQGVWESFVKQDASKMRIAKSETESTFNIPALWPFDHHNVGVIRVPVAGLTGLCDWFNPFHI